MSVSQTYCIVETERRGKIAVAARDILPGELIVQEDKPLLSYTQGFLSQQIACNQNSGMIMAAYNTFVDFLSPAEKEKVLTLFGPTKGFNAENVRKAATEMTLSNERNRKLTEDEIDVFVKVAQVVRLNMFETGDGDHALYEELTRFSHSCRSNCMYSIRGKVLHCYARDFIKAGEELTISYVGERDVQATHVRRDRYLQAKDFTCHCPRCDAVGDDTRQFDCSYARCKGVMMVCQPINQNKTFDPTLSYSDVEYVERHLLPCTVCRRKAPAEYQQEMLALEDTLSDLATIYGQKLSDLLDARKRLDHLEPLLKEIQALKIPRRHAAALPLLKVELRTKHAIYLNATFICNTPQLGPKFAAAVLEYIATIENIFHYLDNFLSTELNLAVTLYIKMCIVPAFEPRAEKAFCLKALRMHLLLRGRDMREEVLDEVVCRCHEKVPSLRSTEVCAFCEESPVRAAFTLSRCGRCKQVAYCSVECQKAHWKVHKKSCKKVV